MAAELIRDKNPLASSSKIHIIDRREFTWTNISGGSILLDAFLELEKAKAIRNEQTKIQSHENLAGLIKIFKSKRTSIGQRISITQLLTVMILQGSLPKMIE